MIASLTNPLKMFSYECFVIFNEKESLITLILPQYICLEILHRESALNILQWNISVSNWIIPMCKKVTLWKYCSRKVFWIFFPIKYPLKRAVGQHCYGKTFSGPTSISQESRLSLGPLTGFGNGLAPAGLQKRLSPQTVRNTCYRNREIHMTKSKKYILQNCLSPQTVATLPHLAP